MDSKEDLQIFIPAEEVGIKIQILEHLINDAERRIGSYIACGGEKTDPYVQAQISKIKAWTDKIEELLVS